MSDEAREDAYVSWSSAELAAMVELSCALHSMDVMGCVWYLKWATNASSCHHHPQSDTADNSTPARPPCQQKSKHRLLRGTEEGTCC